MQIQVILTDEGLRNYEEELEFLKTVKRKEIAEKLKEARAQGDLSENAEYDAAKDEQGINESRIQELEAMLKNVKVIDSSELTNEMVHVGSKIKVHDYDFDEDVDYQIVGASEADPFNGKLSDESPVGMALLGHAIGDVVENKSHSRATQAMLSRLDMKSLVLSRKQAEIRL